MKGRYSVPGCGQPARSYPCGWRCDGHRPGVSTDPRQGAGTDREATMTITWSIDE